MYTLVFLIVLVCIVKVSEPYRIEVSDPAQYRYEKEEDDKGNYNYVNNVYPYDSNRGLFHKETGTVTKSKSDKDNDYIIVRGEYSYNDGQYKYEVTYVADENGYRAHVTKTPLVYQSPVPEQPIGTPAIMSLAGGIG